MKIILIIIFSLSFTYGIALLKKAHSSKNYGPLNIFDFLTRGTSDTQKTKKTLYTEGITTITASLWVIYQLVIN